MAAKPVPVALPSATSESAARVRFGGDGIRRQRAAISAWARSERVEILEWYEELGVSGTLTDRPALARMLVDLEEQSVPELVVVESVDRLARDLYVQETIIRDVRRLGLELASATQGELTADPSRELVRQIMGAIAQYDKTMVVQKLAIARARKRARDGRCEGRKPFGYFEAEQEALERIRQLRRKRGGKRLRYRRIAKALNDEGLQTRTGRPWAPQTVAGIVKARFPNMANE